MYKNILSEMVRAAVSASERIIEIYNGKFAITEKEDSSPLTEADIESNRIITSHLLEKFPEFSILTEEEADDGSRLTNKNGVFIIDPLDGTKEFVNRNGEFCVSLALAVGSRLMIGVIAVPVRRVIYYALRDFGSFKVDFDDITDGFSAGVGKKLAVSAKTDGLTVVLSRSHKSPKLEQLLSINASRISSSISVGSCLKGCMIAEGLADVHYKFGPGTKEWDTAAMQIVCEEAGASFTDIHGNPVPANRVDYRNTEGYIILNHPESALDIDMII